MFSLLILEYKMASFSKRLTGRHINDGKHDKSVSNREIIVKEIPPEVVYVYVH